MSAGGKITPWPRNSDVYNGMPINLDFHSNELMSRIENLEYKKDDIIIASYPKAGTTMTQEIVYLVINKGDRNAAGQDYVSARIPFLENTLPTESLKHGSKLSLELFLKQESPRMGKTHLQWRIGPGRAADKFGCKLIYVMRNPKDTAVSNYYFAKSFTIGDFEGPFSDFLFHFLAPDILYGNIFDHYLGYWHQRHRQNVLIIYYEDLVHDHRAQVVKIAEFLEQELSETVIDTIVEATKFQTMKRNEMTNYTQEEFKEGFKFMRKGQTGDWKNHFTAEEAAMMDKLIMEKLTSVGMKF